MSALDQPTPAGVWQAAVWARIAREAGEARDGGPGSVRERGRRPWALASIYAVLLVVLLAVSADAVAGKQMEDRRARAAMKQLGHRAQHSLALVETREAEAAVHQQLVHVAYARALAERPGASDDAVALVQARVRALHELLDHHREALGQSISLAAD